ncbi:hypothetical protein C3L33_19778, partial [Rhododendron williamsianum]
MGVLINSMNSSVIPTPVSLPRERQRFNLSATQVNFQPNMAEMKKVFDKFDTNKDGKISREEYKLAVKAMGAANMEKEVVRAFQVMDANGDRFIDFKEFMKVNNDTG